MEWMPVEAGDQILVDEKSRDTWTLDNSVNSILTHCKYVNFLLITTVKSPDVNTEDVTLIAKKDQYDLSHLNEFIATEIKKTLLLNRECWMEWQL